VADSASRFVAGPFNSGDIAKITQDGASMPEVKTMAGVVVAHILIHGDALVSAVDADGKQV